MGYARVAMRRTVLTTLTALGGVLLAGACAPSARWEHPVLEERYWSYDLDACEGKAWAEAERDVAYRHPIVRAPGKWPDRSLAANMARYEAADRADGLVAECMTARGYRLVEAKPED